MSKRIWVLAILIAIALLTRALDAYEILVRPTSLLEPMGFNFAIENNRMTVISMDSTDHFSPPYCAIPASKDPTNCRSICHRHVALQSVGHCFGALE